MIVLSCPSFQDSIRPCPFNPIYHFESQFSHDHLILSIFLRFN